MSRRALTVKMPLVRAIAVCDVESEAEAEAKAVAVWHHQQQLWRRTETIYINFRAIYTLNLNFA